MNKDSIKEYKNGPYMDEYKKDIENILALDTKCDHFEQNIITIQNFKNKNRNEELKNIHRAIKK